MCGVFPPETMAEPERKISNDVHTYWTNFDETGDPNGAGLPVWPGFDSKTWAYLKFTDAGPFPKQNRRGAFCLL